jgi:hypothetical protein
MVLESSELLNHGAEFAFIETENMASRVPVLRNSPQHREIKTHAMIVACTH